MCKKKCSLSPGITVGVGQCKFHYNIVNFDKKRSVPNDLEVEDDRYNTGQLYVLLQFEIKQ